MCRKFFNFIIGLNIYLISVVTGEKANSQMVFIIKSYGAKPTAL